MTHHSNLRFPYRTMSEREMANIEALDKERVARKISPKLAEFSKRIYNISGDNYSFRSLLNFLGNGFVFAGAIGRAGDGGIGGTTAPVLATTAFCSELRDFPFWVIPRKMGEIIMNVKPPSVWDVSSMLFGFPSMQFILPRNQLVGDAGEGVSIVSVAHFTDETKEELSRTRGVEINSGNRLAGVRSGLIVSAMSDEGILWHLSIPVPESGIVDDDLINSLPTMVDVPENNSRDWLRRSLLPYALTTLAFMSARPEVAGEPTRLIKKIKHTGRESWSPRILGAKYIASFEGQKAVGGGRVMPIHWRSAHFRQQHYGPGNKHIKQVLIDDVLVNAPKQN